MLDCAIENINDSHPNKIPRAGPASDTFCNSNNTQAQPNQKSEIPSFSVQIVQQFTSNTSQSHSQTIQTNVTVQALSNNSIKTSNSPLPSNAVSSTPSPGCVSSGTPTNDSYNQIPNSGGNNSGSVSSTSVSLGTNVECKQEPDANFAQCSVNGSRPLTDLSNDLTSANNIIVNSKATSPTDKTGDRVSESISNLFDDYENEDGLCFFSDELIEDILDEVFATTSSDAKSLHFTDNSGMKDKNQKDEKDSFKPKMSLNKSIQNNSQSNFQNTSNSPNVFNMSQSQQAVFDFQTGANSMNNSQTVPNNSNTLTQSYQSGRMGSYAATSSNLSSISNNGLGLDFKLTEPSPAAQTLKQMAEQHQNMQQKQQQLSLGIVANHPRSPFGSDSFPDMRTNFMNGSPTSVQKSPTGLFQPMGFSQQQNFSTANGPTIKQEVVTPNTPIYQPNVNQHLSDMELHKRRQVMQMQQSQMGTITRPQFSHSPEQKRTFPGTRLSHFNDPSSGHPTSEGNASISPVPHHPAPFMRGVSTPGVTPPPQAFGSSPSPSAGTTVHMSQSQQIQMSVNNQQLQMSQSQQQLIVNQDKKPTIIAQHQQQNIAKLETFLQETRRFYSGQNAHHMAQSQSVNFQFSNAAIRGTNTMVSQRSNPTSYPGPVQRVLNPQYMNKPPPDYQSSLESDNCNNHVLQPISLSQNNPMQINMSDSLNANSDHSGRPIDQRNSIPVSLAQSYNMNSPETKSRPYSGIPLNQLYPDIFNSNNNSNNNNFIPNSRTCPGQSPVNSNPNMRRQFSNVLPMQDLIARPSSGESPSTDSHSNVDMHPYPGTVPINSSPISRSGTNESPSANGMKAQNGNMQVNDLLTRLDKSTSNNNLSYTDVKSFPSHVNDLISRTDSDDFYPGTTLIPYVGISDEAASNNNKFCSGTRHINELMSRPEDSQSTKHVNDLMSRSDENTKINSNTERSFHGIPMSDLIPINNSNIMHSNQSISNSADGLSVQDIPHSNRQYNGFMPGVENISMNRGCSNPSTTSDAVSVIASSSYSSASYSLSSSVSVPYSNISSVSNMSAHMFSESSHSTVTNQTAQITSNKGRGKQTGPRTTKQCNSLQRQQKPPNVNVGPEGLNISQRPPVMATDWRQAYMHQTRHQNATNGNDDIIVTYASNGPQEYGAVNNSNVNNIQARNSVKSNSSLGDGSSLVSVSQNSNLTEMHSNKIQIAEPPTSNQSLPVSSNNPLHRTEIQLSEISSTVTSESNNIFSTPNLPNDSMMAFLDELENNNSTEFFTFPGEMEGLPMFD